MKRKKTPTSEDVIKLYETLPRGERNKLWASTNPLRDEAYEHLHVMLNSVLCQRNVEWLAEMVNVDKIAEKAGISFANIEKLSAIASEWFKGIGPEVSVFFAGLMAEYWAEINAPRDYDLSLEVARSRLKGESFGRIARRLGISRDAAEKILKRVQEKVFAPIREKLNALQKYAAEDAVRGLEKYG